MDRIVRTLRRPLRRARDLERFVRLIVAGGVALVVGLWIATLSTPPTPAWLVGVALALVGVGALAAGIHSEITY